METGSGAASLVCRLKDVYRAIAAQSPLGESLGLLAGLAARAAGAEVAVVFGLRGEDLETLAASRKVPVWLQAPARMPALAAPWWRLRGQAVEMSGSAAWAPYAGLAGGVRWCWSDRLTTAAGEMVGCLTLFGRAPFGDGPSKEVIEELKELAALAVEQANLLEELKYRAERDPVTGLWNRRQLEEWIEQMRQGERGAPAALVLVSLEGARRVREILGEETGDALLRSAAERVVRTCGAGFAARLSGDEIAVLTRGAGEDPGSFGAQLLRLLEEPFLMGGHEIHARPAIGVAAAEGAEEVRQWLRRARAAAAAARARRNGARCVVFDPTIAIEAPERLELERRLRGAAGRGELLLHYQPQVRLRDGRTAGHEALMRWRNPEIGTVSPAAFIPVAEETGLIVELGRWALEEACRQARRWQERRLPARIGVNVSALQLADAGFPEDVRRALADSGIDPRLVELEITESAVVENLKLAAERMRELRGLGVQFALDDFGTGTSSLAYLKELPVNRIKVDRSFLGELDQGRAPLLESIIRMAHGLALEVIVEGVETEEQRAALERMGADEVQGYLTGRPMPAEEVEARKA
ncbi:MAG: putative bifunctional diguanylate cyclase/phosphodiesterase [Bryobacteraceae bacterium]